MSKFNTFLNTLTPTGTAQSVSAVVWLGVSNSGAHFHNAMYNIIKERTHGGH